MSVSLADDIDQKRNLVKLSVEEFKSQHKYFAGDFIDQELVTKDGYGYTKFKGKIISINESPTGWVYSIKSTIDSQDFQFDLIIDRDQKYFSWFEFVQEDSGLSEKYSDTTPKFVYENLDTEDIVVVQITTTMPPTPPKNSCDEYCKKVFSDFDSRYDNSSLNQEITYKTKSQFNIGILSSIGKI